MLFHPNLRHFGRLELFEVYSFYDTPILVSCKSASGALFLAVAVDDDARSEEWLYVAVSRDRLLEVRSGGIDLHSAFSKPEDGIAYLVQVPYDVKRPAKVAVLDAVGLPEDKLPAIGAALNLRTPTLPVLESLQDRALRTRRDILRIALKIPESLRTEAPAKILGNMLTTLQDLIFAIGQSLMGVPGRRGTQKKEIVVTNELMVLGFGDGSFEVELASSQYADLFDVSSASAPMEEFVAVLEDGSNADILHAHLQQLKVRATGDYLRFLKAIEKRVDYTTVEWASPSGRTRKAGVSALTVRAAIAVIESERLEEKDSFTIPAVLIGANIDKRTYEVWHAHDHEERYEGKISKDGVASVGGARIGNTYLAHLRQTLKVKTTTGVTVEHVELIHLEPLPTSVDAAPTTGGAGLPQGGLLPARR